MSIPLSPCCPKSSVVRILPRNSRTRGADGLLDIVAISNVGQFVSIDSRPVSCTRDTLKEIVSKYKSYLKSSSSIESHEKLMNPFLCLNICCPPGSYDPNLEPAKDNVLFTDANGLLRMVERFFVHVYGEKEAVAANGLNSTNLEDGEGGFELLLNRKPKAPEPDVSLFGRHERSKTPSNKRSSDATPDDALFLEDSMRPPAPMNQGASDDLTTVLMGSADATEYVSPSLREPQPRRNTWKSTMYDGDEDDGLVLEDVVDSYSEMAEDYDELAAKDVKHNNPWTIAKMNASIKPRIPVSDLQKSGAVGSIRQPITPVRTVAGRNIQGTPGQESRHGTPSTLLESNGPSHLPSPASTLYSEHEFSSPISVPLPTNLRVGHQVRINPTGSVDLRQVSNGTGAVARHIQNDATTSGTGFVSARTLPIGTSLADIPDISQRPRKVQQRKQRGQQRGGAGLPQPFVPSINRSQHARSEMPPTQQSPRHQDHQPHRITDDLDNPPKVRQGSEHLGLLAGRNSVQSVGLMHPDLAVTIDFERRKEAAMQKRRAQPHQQTLDQLLCPYSEQQRSRSRSWNSPHKNRYNKAIAALQVAEEPVEKNKSAFVKGDPRRYLAHDLEAEERDDHKDQSSQFHQLKRRKTAHMPFESVPTGEAVHNLMITMDISKRDLIDEETKLVECDEYIKSGEHPDGFDCVIDEAQAWDSVLQNLIESKFEKERGHTQGMSFDLWALLQQNDISCEESVAILDT